MLVSYKKFKQLEEMVYRLAQTQGRLIKNTELSKIKIKLIEGSGAKEPIYATNGSSGFDIEASIINHNGDHGSLIVLPGETVKILTGYCFEIPKGWELQIRSRSGLATKHGIIVINQPGTVDSDYRGEIMVALKNIGDEPFIINHGDRIAQGVFCSVVQPVFERVESLDETERGAGGFGSTGMGVVNKI